MYMQKSACRPTKTNKKDPEFEVVGLRSEGQHLELETADKVFCPSSNTDVESAGLKCLMALKSFPGLLRYLHTRSFFSVDSV